MASIAVAMTRCHSVGVGTSTSSLDADDDRVTVVLSVVISSGQRYWFQP
jgi:hypothetical protein